MSKTTEMSTINLKIVTFGYPNRKKSSSITTVVSTPEKCSQVTIEFQACATFLSRKIRAETAMNPDTTQPVPTFHAV